MSITITIKADRSSHSWTIDPEDDRTDKIFLDLINRIESDVNLVIAKERLAEVTTRLKARKGSWWR